MFKNLKKLSAVTQSQTILIVGIVFIILVFTVGVPFLKSVKLKTLESKLKVLHFQLLNSSNTSFMRYSETPGDFDVTLPISDFIRHYFSLDMPIVAKCKEDTSPCWGAIQYKDLANKTYSNKFTDGYVLNNGAVVGFRKTEDNQVSILLDVDGKSGENVLGHDVFIYSIYNNSHKPKLCDETVYNEHYIQNGLHVGGVDKCGIPHDVYDYTKLRSPELEDSCNKKSVSYENGFGVGAACSAVIKVQDWTIDKNYPW